MQGDGDDESHYFFFSAPTSPLHYILRSSPPAPLPMATATAPLQPPRGTSSSPRTRTYRSRSASPPLSPQVTRCIEVSDPSASASSSLSSYSTSSSSFSSKNTTRRISLRDLLTRTGCYCVVEQAADTAGAETRLGFWALSIWTSRSKKALPYPAPQTGRRSKSSDMAAPTKWAPSNGTATSREEARRRMTFLPCRQGLILGCLGFGAWSYGLAKSMHPLYSR